MLHFSYCNYFIFADFSYTHNPYRSLNEVSEDGEEEYTSDGERMMQVDSKPIKGNK